MKKEIIAKFTLGGFSHEICLVDAEYLMSLSKHKKNRPSGDIDDDVAPYLPSEITEAKAVTKKLYNRFVKKGFDVNVKTFVVGRINKIEYKLDGQHCIAAIRQLNSENVAKNGEPLYNLFKVEIIDFENNEKAFIKMLEKFNNLVTKYKPQDYANTSVDDEVGDEMRRISKLLDITPKLSLIIMYGNSTSACYENLTKDTFKRNYDKTADSLKKIFDNWESNGAKQISDKFRKGDCFIVLNELLSNIWHKTFLNKKIEGLDESEANEYVSNLCDKLIEHISNIDYAAFIDLDTKSSDGVTRKKFYKDKLKQLLLNRNGSISKKYRDSVRNLNGTELKKIIECWAIEGINCHNGKK